MVLSNAEKQRRWVKRHPEKAKITGRERRRRWRSRHIEKKRDIQRKWFRGKRLELINSLGGKCLLCGFSGYPSALEAHHLDRGTKHPGLKGGRAIVQLPKKEFLVEVSKCVLLCSNCHHGVESKDLDIGTATTLPPYWP